MFEIPIKPISINDAYKGRRYSTDEHKKFKDLASILLRKLNLPKLRPKQEFYVIYRFHIGRSADYDNCIKVVQDQICNALGVDDRWIGSCYVKKIKAKKGDEKIEFNIFQNEYDQLKAIQCMNSEI